MRMRSAASSSDNMNADNIVFDPATFFKTRQDERPFLEALTAWRTPSNSRSPKEIEENFGLPRSSFLAYLKWKGSPEQELPHTIRKPKQQISQNQIPSGGGGGAAAPPPLLPAAAAIDAIVPEAERKTLLELASNSNSVLFSDNLFAAANLALIMQRQQSISLWKASCQVDELNEYFHKQRAIFECARHIAENPAFYPSQIQGGIKSCVNDPNFVQFLAQALMNRDTTAMDTLYGEDLEIFFAEQHHKFYHQNAAARVERLSKDCCKKLRKQLKMTSNALNFVSARRLVAMGDPRNFVSFFVGATLTFQDLALELRFNYDETSLLVCADARSGTNKFLGLAWTTQEMMKVLKTLNRSPGAQSKTLSFTPRMVQWGLLAAACGRLHLFIMKIYDRAIHKQYNLKWVRLPQQVNGCDIIIMFIRGKQLGPGAAAADTEGVKETGPKSTKEKAEAEERAKKMFQSIDHGGLDRSHSSEKEVAELTMTLVAKKIAEVKLKYHADERKYKETGFETGSHHEMFSTPAASQAVATEESDEIECEDLNVGDSSEDESDEDEGSNEGADGDVAEKSEEPADCCPHLDASCSTNLHRCVLMKQSSGAYYICSICDGQGRGPLYSCDHCKFFAHPSCCLPKDKATEAVRSTTHVVRQLAAAAGHENVSCRAALSLDGAVGQSSALEGTAQNPGIIEREFLPIGCDVLKGSAQCSLSENPLDLMRSFMGIKRDKTKWTVQNGRPSKMMSRFIEKNFAEIMKDVSASDRRTFVLALSHVERCISKFFTLDAVQSGWEKAGLIDLNFHTIMSHFLEWRNMSLADIEGIQGCLPAFFHEMSTTFELSDQTMAMMQRYFPVDFKVYPTGRETLSISRKRCTLFSMWLQLMREKAAKFEAENHVEVPGDEELMPDNPKLAVSGKAICPCVYNNFHGRHYANTAEGWQLHIQSKSHQNWRKAELEKLSEGESGRQAVVAAHELPWFAQECCPRLKHILAKLNANASIGKRFVKAQTRDADIPMLLMMTENRWMLDFGMQPGQVKVFISNALGSSDSYEDIVPFQHAVCEQMHAWAGKKRCIETGNFEGDGRDWTEEEKQQDIATYQSWIDTSVHFLQREVVEPLQQQHEDIAGVDLGPGFNGFEAADAVPMEDGEGDADDEAAKRKKARAKRLRAQRKF